MKNILGSLFFCIALFANEYSVIFDKHEAFVKEPIHLKLTYFAKNKETIIWVKFAPKATKDFKVVLLKKKTLTTGYENEFLIFPLKEGNLKLPIELTVKRASKQEIQTDILGTGYEQTKIIEGKITSYPIEPLKIFVKKTPKADLYGDFTLHLQLDKTRAKAYEPVYAILTITGTGFDQIPSLHLKTNPKIKILQDKPIQKVEFAPDGAHIRYKISYALITKSSFEIEPLKLKMFDYHTLQTLATPKYQIDVKTVPIQPDKTDNPPKIEPVFHTFEKTFVYIFIFLSGLLSGILLFILLKRVYQKQFEILLAKDEKELLQILAPLPGFEKEKELLNEAISTNKKISLVQIKKKILKELT
ncbi:MULTISPECIES: BatD family protein [unclassified Nitratiruptor]|uniref:BatD family protein n=1 Tax=unclassified Nitratiruptor TaxID=2624044 RepID=UPI001915DAE2|nr:MULTISPECIES: BatD family protein [unclassified Nitratiruptor]BCD59889.1 hypothetical protein NitYY0810_C0648 [Nitratiruptor sp. YY08-10]BCD63812.1 hypothetical protein NitYY0814_C0647 [Nitratiruptor sp. YY08-14]